MRQSTVILIFVLTLIHAAFSTPLLVDRDVREVSLGPGLPSLTSLNLTSADLFAMPRPSMRKSFLKFMAPF
jgi:hypothetical protein